MKGEKDQSTETEKRNGQWRAEEGYAKSVGKNGNLSLRSYFHRRFVRRVFSFDALREHHGLYSLRMHDSNIFPIGTCCGSRYLAQ